MCRNLCKGDCPTSMLLLLPCDLQVDFPVQAGDRLLLKVAEVDVRSGLYRMYVDDRLSTYTASSSAAAGELNAETGDSAESDLSEEELERLLLLDLAGDAAAVVVSSDESDESDKPQGLLRWRSAAPPSSSGEEDSDDMGLVFGSFTSSDVGSEVLSFDREQEQQLPTDQLQTNKQRLAAAAANEL